MAMTQNENEMSSRFCKGSLFMHSLRRLVACKRTVYKAMHSAQWYCCWKRLLWLHLCHKNEKVQCATKFIVY